MRGLPGPKTILLFFLLCFISSSILNAQNLPVAVNDSTAPIIPLNAGGQLDTIGVNVLVNDYDPEGMELEVASVVKQGSPEYAYFHSDSTIFYIYNPNSLTCLLEQVFRYRIRRKNDTTQLSNWATLYINPASDPTFPVARSDTVRGIPGYPWYVNALRNDEHPLGDSIRIFYSHATLLGDSILSRSGATSDVDYWYCITDSADWTRMDVGRIHFISEHNHYFDFLDVNNISARFNCFGNHFWDLDDQRQFIVPKSGIVPSFWLCSFWIGGRDPQNELHVAGERYLGPGQDYRSGPVSNVYDSTYDIRWYHVWKLNRSDIEHHKAKWWTPGYEPVSDILTWPGNGDPERGQSATIAPFDDLDNDGIYEPMEGDAPRIKGDQALFFVFNDARQAHGESQGVPLGIEVRAMAYAFDAPEDSSLWNTIFLHYDIENRSDTSYHDVCLGLFADFSLGDPWDDRVEADVGRGMFFAYNGREEDGQEGDPYSYGSHPPAQGVQLLGGALLEPDGVDNPKYDINGNQVVDYSINGMGFGDGIPDNERLGMTHFITIYGGVGFASPPDFPDDWYNYMQSVWMDETKQQYGGNGHPFSGSVGPDCNFHWPRDTDPLNWGTAGMWPNGGYNQNGLYWTSEETGMNPTYVNGLGSSGPFNLAPGQIQPLDLAFPWARDYDGTAWESALLLKQRATYLKEKFQADPEFFSGIQKAAVDQNIRIIPNPARDQIRLSFSADVGDVVIMIRNLQGATLMRYSMTPNQYHPIRIASLESGVYLVSIQNDKVFYTVKLIKQ